jgi:hypothetical protein
VVGAIWNIFALPDLGYVHHGTLHVIDWKSGRRSEGHQTQVLLSSFWALSTPAGREAKATAGHLEYLSEGTEVKVEIPEDLGERVSAIVLRRTRDAGPARRPASNAADESRSARWGSAGPVTSVLCERHRQQV